MQPSMPDIKLPWRRRKTPLERTQHELRKVQKEIGRQVDKLDLSKIELPQVRGEDIGAAVDDTRRVLGTGMEQAAVVAGQLGRQAGKFGREAGKFGRQAGKRGGELSRELIRAGDENIKNLRAKNVGGELKDLTDDVRSLRVTRQKQGPNMMPGIALLGGLGAGMAAMFFFDPEQGRRRRALLRDQLTKWSRVASEQVSGQARDLRNRGMGIAHEVRKTVESARQGGNGMGSEDVSATTPNAAADLAATDEPTGQQEPVAQAVGSTWSQEVNVPEGNEGQPDIGRTH